MKVLIHALGANRGGAVRHLRSFLPELALADRKNEYVVLVRQSLPPLGSADNIRVERLSDATASRWLRRTAADLVSLPARARREGFDAFVSLTNFGPVWSPIPHVLFQRNAIYFSEVYLSNVDRRERLETVMRRRLAVASMRRAAAVVTPSKALADMIRQMCPEVEGVRFVTMHHGFDPQALGGGVEESRPLPGSKWRLLYPTFAGTYKGFDILFEALALLKAENVEFSLLVTVRPEPALVQQVNRLGLARNVVFLGTVAADRMSELYAGSDLMVFPSLCESFGFPLIEAMGHRLAIVAPSTAVNREICQEAALYYDWQNPHAAAGAILQALEPETREALRQGSRCRQTNFDWSWTRYAREFSSLMSSLGPRS